MEPRIRNFENSMIWLNEMAKETGQLVYFFDSKTGKVQWIGAIEEITGYTHEEYQSFDVDSWAIDKWPATAIMLSILIVISDLREIFCSFRMISSVSAIFPMAYKTLIRHI